MTGSSPDIRLKVTGHLEGTIDFLQFQRWFASAAMKIERDGSDDEVDFSNRVENLLAEFTGDHISADQSLEALRVESELHMPERVLAAPAPR